LLATKKTAKWCRVAFAVFVVITYTYGQVGRYKEMYWLINITLQTRLRRCVQVDTANIWLR
jgi:hypothetical protein